MVPIRKLFVPSLLALAATSAVPAIAQAPAPAPAAPGAQQACPMMTGPMMAGRPMDPAAGGAMQQHMAEMHEAMQQMHGEMQAMRSEMQQMRQEMRRRR